MFCRCEEVPFEPLCAAVLTNTHYAPGVPLITENLNDLNNELRRISQFPELAVCIELINELNCIVRYPTCNNNMEKLIPICQSQCPMINHQITQCSIDLISHGDSPVLAELLSRFQCENPENYYSFPIQYIETNSDDCLMISKL